MRDPVSKVFAEIDELSVPRSDIREVKRRARPQIVMRRLVASVSLVAVAAAVPLVSDGARDIFDTSEEMVPRRPPASSTVQSPNASHRNPLCEVPTLEPRYLPWAQDSDGIPPTHVNSQRRVSTVSWRRGGTTDIVSLSKLLYSGAGGEPGPSLPDGTAGVLHRNTEEPDPLISPPFGISGYVVRWSAIWTSRFPDGCKSMHLMVQMEGLSEEQEKEELIKIARSLVDPDG